VKNLFCVVPVVDVHTEIDGHLYAHIPYALEAPFLYSAPRIVERKHMVRFVDPSHIRGNDALVWFARVGDAIDIGPLPAGVTVEQS